MSESSVEVTPNDLSSDQRIQALKSEHSDLEIALEQEEARPLPDSLAIASIKRRKLAIKDEIEQLDGH
jgi:hypothetical protein